MTVKDLWVHTTYVGKVQIEDETHRISNPLVVGECLTELVFDDEHNFTELANKEVEYFDFLFGTMRIKLKEN